MTLTKTTRPTQRFCRDEMLTFSKMCFPSTPFAQAQVILRASMCATLYFTTFFCTSLPTWTNRLYGMATSSGSPRFPGRATLYFTMVFGTSPTAEMLMMGIIFSVLGAKYRMPIGLVLWGCAPHPSPNLHHDRFPLPTAYVRGVTDCMPIGIVCHRRALNPKP